MTGQLFLLDGTSGLWKADVVEYVHAMHDATIVKKLSTRFPRAGEDVAQSDLLLVSADVLAAQGTPYTYSYGEAQYGVAPESLREALKTHATVFLIVRDARLIRRIKHDFADSHPVAAFIYADLFHLQELLLSEDQAHVLPSIERAFQDYLKTPECYDEVLIRPTDGNDLRRLIDVLIERGGRRRRAISSPSGQRILLASTPAVRHALLVMNGIAGIVLGGIAVSVATSGDLTADRGLLVLALLTLLGAALFALQLLLARHRWRALAD